MTMLVALGIITVGLFTSGPIQAQEPPSKILIKGQIVNGTNGEQIKEGLQVFLVSNDPLDTDRVETNTKSGGMFHFETLSPKAGTELGISVQYQGALYGSLVNIVEGKAEPVTLTIHEASGREELIVGTSASLLLARVERSTQTLWALEIVKFVNNSNLTYVPGPEPMKLIRFGLPPKATGLTVDTDLIGADVLQVDRGFAITASVPPGKHEVMYAYNFPYNDTELDLTKSLPYGADELRILIPEDLAGLGSTSGEAEQVTIGDTLYQLITKRDLVRGEKFSFRVQRLPKAGIIDNINQQFNSISLQYAAVIVLGLVMTSMLFFAIATRNTNTTHQNNPENISSRARILHEMAALQIRYEGGEIKLEEYKTLQRSFTSKLTRLPEEDGAI